MDRDAIGSTTHSGSTDFMNTTHQPTWIYIKYGQLLSLRTSNNKQDVVNSDIIIRILKTGRWADSIRTGVERALPPIAHSLCISYSIYFCTFWHNQFSSTRLWITKYDFPDLLNIRQVTFHFLLLYYFSRQSYITRQVVWRYPVCHSCNRKPVMAGGCGLMKSIRLSVLP